MNNFLPKGEFYFLVSGGVDSVAAAHWLSKTYRKNFTILHFFHRTQPDNSVMEKCVNELATNLCVGCRVIYNTTNAEHWSEAELRDWRLSWMSAIGGNFVTAHHLNDAVENYMFNCLNGTPEYKPIQEVTEFEKHKIWHPFLLTNKKSFKTYVKKNKLERFVCEDQTNNDTKFKRNWMRNNILPEISNRGINLETVVKKKFYKI